MGVRQKNNRKENNNKNSINIIAEICKVRNIILNIQLIYNFFKIYTYHIHKIYKQIHEIYVKFWTKYLKIKI